MCWPTRKHPPEVERLVVEQPAASASDRPSVVTKSFSFCSANSNTVRGVWSIVRYASDGSSRRVLLSRLRDCTPCKRMQCVVGLLPDTPVWLQLLVVQWRARLGAAWACLWTRRLESKLCHGQLCVSRVSFPRQSVQQRFNTLASLSQPGPSLVFCTNYSFSFCVSLSRSSPHPETMKSSPCTTISKSRDACRNAHGHLLELSKPTSALTF